MGLIFGAPGRRKTALAALDTASLSEFPAELVALLDYPTDARLANRVLLRLRRRDDVPDDLASLGRIHNELKQGHLGDAIDLLREVGIPPEFRCFWLASWTTLDYPVPDSLVRTRLSPDRLTSDSPLVRLHCSSLYLLGEGRVTEASELLPRIQAAVDTLFTDEADVPPIMAQLRGYRAWQGGDLERAAALWSKPGFGPLNFQLLLRGDLHRDLGNHERAEGWYLTPSAWEDPLAHERLGQLYEEMDKPEKAAAAYRRFIAAWEDADPELQPRVEEARKRLKALTKGGRRRG